MEPTCLQNGSPEASGGLPKAGLTWDPTKRLFLKHFGPQVGTQKIAFSGQDPPKKILRPFLVRIFMVPGRFWRPSNIEPKMERRKSRFWTRCWSLWATFFKTFWGGSGRSRGTNNMLEKHILPDEAADSGVRQRIATKTKNTF